MEKPGRIREDQGGVEMVRVGGEGQGRKMKSVEGLGGRWKGWSGPGKGGESHKGVDMVREGWKGPGMVGEAREC